MCGILGVVVKKNSVNVVRNLFDIFDHQAGRGVRGAGISINSAEGLWRFRSYSPYRIFAAYNAAIWDGVHDGDRIVFHHRTPTSTANAPRFNHPFENEDKTIHLIHNGIIANDVELFNALRERHTFETLEGDKFTDSEVLLHLFEDEYEKSHHPVTSLRKMSERSTGSFAIAMQRAGEACIWLVKHNNPVVISKDSDDNFYFSSELDETNTNLTKVCEMGDGEIGRLTKDGYEKCGDFTAPVTRWVYHFADEKKKHKKGKQAALSEIPEYDDVYGFSWKKKRGDWMGW
jgi:glucosamine 6-phosphate synthetase-like amidotransferase/phosphosugar isomerase protein